MFFSLASLPPFSFRFWVTPAAVSFTCEETGPNKRGRALGLKRGVTRQGARNAWLASILHGKLRKKSAYIMQTQAHKLELWPNFTLKTSERSNTKFFTWMQKSPRQVCSIRTERASKQPCVHSFFLIVSLTRYSLEVNSGLLLKRKNATAILDRTWGRRQCVPARPRLYHVSCIPIWTQCFKSRLNTLKEQNKGQGDP